MDVHIYVCQILSSYCTKIFFVRKCIKKFKIYLKQSSPLGGNIIKFFGEALYITYRFLHTSQPEMKFKSDKDMLKITEISLP